MHFSDFSTISYEFSKFTKKNRKGIVSFTERTLGSFKTLQMVPWLEKRENKGGGGPCSGERSRRRRGVRGQEASVSQGAPDVGFGWGAGSPKRLRRRGAEHSGGG